MIDPADWGIEPGYWDVSGWWHDLDPSSQVRLLAAMGAEEGKGPPAGPPLWFVTAGETTPVNDPCTLALDDGSVREVTGALPADLPIGYHDLHPRDGGPVTRLVITPRRCHLPEDLRTWGWALQLHSVRSTSSWGFGDFGDLRRVATWADRIGAGVLGVNPLHAASPVVPQQPSPYYPTSRLWLNPLYLRIEEVPGAGAAAVDLAVLADAGRALDAHRRIDRDEVFRLKREALDVLWGRFPGAPGFDAFRRAHGRPLERFATYCALAERHGPKWTRWPAALRRPEHAAVAAFAATHAHRVAYHQWLQWLCDVQLGKASEALTLVHDLAIGFDPTGADAWTWQDVLAPGVTVGAPPDAFNVAGQDWGLPAFVPWKLRHQLYQPFIDTIRAAFRHAGGLRVDHVMGLFRLFWIPEGKGPGAGGYVRYPARELLDIVAVESARAGAFVVGEDLGTVEDEVRRELAERRVLSCRLLWFEPTPTSDFREQALAAVTTHDLPTVAGVWTGSDLEAQRAIGRDPGEAGAEEMRRRLLEAGAPEGGGPVDAAVAAYRALAQAPSRVVLATLEDALGVEERPNMPGTVAEWPNWSLALPAPLEDVEQDPGVLAVAAALGDHR